MGEVNDSIRELELSAAPVHVQRWTVAQCRTVHSVANVRGGKDLQ